MRNCSFTDAKFRKDIHFNGCDIQHCHFSGPIKDLRILNMQDDDTDVEAHLDHVDFSQAEFDQVEFDGFRLDTVELPPPV